MFSSQTPAECYKEIEEFAELEMRMARQTVEAELSLSTESRVQRGRSVTDLRFLKRTSANGYRFVCPENLSDLREGDIVIVHTGDPFGDKRVMHWAGDGFLDLKSEFIDLTSDSDGSALLFSTELSYTVDAYYLDLSASIRQAIQQLGNTERGRDRILPLLMGTVSDDVSMEEYDQAIAAAEKEHFNARQQEAIASGVASDWCTLIQGPPGTGKTRVLANIVKQRLERGQRMLITASTHRAIHEALNAIQRVIPECDTIAKIGQPVTDGSLRVPVYETFYDAPFSRSDQPYVIGATPYAARNKRLSGVEFDCVLMDEASQLTLPLAVMAMLSADTYVIIGDPRQLPPVVLSASPFEAAHHSIFSRVSLPRDLVQLNLSYRMNAELTDWVSENFYSGDLSSASSARDRRLHVEGGATANWLNEVLDPRHSLVWIPTATRNTRRYSLEEADFVHQILSKLSRRGFSLLDVAVITPFRRQARVIRRRLQQSLVLTLEQVGEVTIDTVERMQGQERSVVIVSTAASEPGYIHAIREFLYLPQRVNVAVSRARVKCVVMGSESFVNPAYASEDILEALAHWKDLTARSRIIEL